MSDYPKQVGDEQIPFQGKIVEVVQTPMEVAPGKKVTFEKARRSPGTRLLIVQEGSIWMTKEYREELQGYDIRLPGGKVFDSLSEYNEFLATGKDMIVPATKRALIEAREEVGVVADKAQHFHTSTNGATVQWDLLYFVIDDFTIEEQQLELGENISVQKMSFQEAWDAALSGAMQEDRSVAVLLRYLKQYI